MAVLVIGGEFWDISSTHFGKHHPELQQGVPKQAQCTVSLHSLTEKGYSVKEGINLLLYDILINQMTGFKPAKCSP